MEDDQTYRTFRSFTHSGRMILPTSIDLTVEAPLEIHINGQRHILIMFTPQMTRELVIGFIFTEGIIRGAKEIDECIISLPRNGAAEGIIKADVSIPSMRSSFSRPSGKRVSYSSCGICGTEDYFGLGSTLRRVKSRHRFSMDVLSGLSQSLGESQPLYERTGGAHAAVLFDSKGNQIVHSEDMGRHNALDKVIGAALIGGISSEDKVLVSSGRASLEMILKTARAGFPVFVAMSRPTARAVESAKFYNITLVDLAKGTNRIYSHVRRIKEF